MAVRTVLTVSGLALALAGCGAVQEGTAPEPDVVTCDDFLGMDGAARTEVAVDWLTELGEDDPHDGKVALALTEIRLRCEDHADGSEPIVGVGD